MLEPNTPVDPAHHARLNSFLAILERLGLVALTLAPAIAAPFAKTPVGAAVIAEAPAEQALAGALAAELNPPTA